MSDTPTPTELAASTEPTDPKRGRGRPPGSRNKPRQTGAAPGSLAAAIESAAAPSKNEPGRPNARTASLNALADQLATAYKAFGGTLSVGAAALQLGEATRPLGTRLAAVGDQLVKNADACGLALARWADTNPAVKKWLSGLSTGSGLLMVLAAHAPIIAVAFGKPAELGDLAATLAAPGADLPVVDLASLFGNLLDVNEAAS